MHPVDLIIKNCKDYPNNVAISFNEIDLSYRQLYERIARYASVYGRLNCKNPKIMIYLPQCPDAYAAILGSLYAGGTHTPVNYEAPISKIVDIANALSPELIVTNTEGAQRLNSLSLGALIYNCENIETEELFFAGGCYSNVAYIMFTSGSTGKPKGVMVPNSGLVNYTNWLATLNYRAGDRVSQQPNLGFDISMTDIFGALCNGATLVPVFNKFDKLSLANFIRRERITVWNSTPSALGMIIASGQMTFENMSSVHTYIFCGEPLLQEHLEAIFKINSSATVYNTYGPTEATIAVTWLKLSANNYRAYVCDGAVAIGENIPGNFVHIVNQNPSTNSHEGELFISGNQLAIGYLDDAEKTNLVFVHDKSLAADDRFYKTGDWVKLVEGSIFFKERVDFQVKIKGHRIELDEISAAVRKLKWPLVVSLVNEGSIYVLVEKTFDLVFDELIIRKELKKFLDAYALPSRIFCVDKIPRNENDKIDRKQSLDLLNILLRTV